MSIQEAKRTKAVRHAEKTTEGSYRQWIAPLASCVATGRTDGLDLVHIRHFTGAAMKPVPEHSLPLCRALHTIQETNRLFFPSIGIANPTAEAGELFAIWRDTRNAEWWLARLKELQRRVDREAVAMMLSGVPQ